MLDLELAYRLSDIPYRPDRDLERIETLIRDKPDPHARLRFRAARIFQVYRRGKVVEAERSLDSLRADAAAIGDRAMVYDSHEQAFAYAAREDAWDRALGISRAQVRVARALGDAQREAVSLDQVAWSLLRIDRADEAVEPLESAARLAERLGFRQLLWSVHDSRRLLATIRRDSDALLDAAVRLREIEAETNTGADGDESALARDVLGALRSETIQADEEADAEQERLAAQQAAHERQMVGVGMAAFALVSVLAAMAFLGMRRAQRTARQLAAETRRASDHEASAHRLQHHVQQLERLDSLGMLAAGVAHDFNNLLCSIHGHADLLASQPEFGPSKSLTAIQAAADRGASLCDRLLDYARPDSGGRAVFDVAVVVRELEPMFDLRAERRARIEVDTAAAAAPVLMDRTAIEQVVVNLVHNALDAQVAASRVDVRVDVVDGPHPVAQEGEWLGAFDPAASYARIEVRDDGRGVPAERLRRLFDPFYTTKFEGRGLGLSAAFGIVKAHGGAVHVASRLGCGTSFSVLLPLSRDTGSELSTRVAGAARSSAGAERAAVGSTAESTAGSTAGSSVGPALQSVAGRSVLVVDDEPDVAAFVAEALRAHGLVPHVAVSKSGALQTLERLGSHVDVAVLDVSMPDVDGDELIEAIRPKCGAVVIMSGHGEEQIQDRMGPDFEAHLLRKPFTMQRLVECVAGAGAASEPAT